MSILRVVAVLAAAVPLIAFPITYQITTRGAWRKSVMGRHLMAFMGALGAVMVLTVWGMFAGDLPRWIGPVAWLVIASVSWWRLLLLLSMQRNRK